MLSQERVSLRAQAKVRRGVRSRDPGNGILRVSRTADESSSSFFTLVL